MTMIRLQTKTYDVGVKANRNTNFIESRSPTPREREKDKGNTSYINDAVCYLHLSQLCL
jgi:hypothetical protein